MSDNGPPRCSSVPAQKSDQVKSFPFSWDRKAHGSDDACRHPSVYPVTGPISGPATKIKVENTPNESSSSTDGLRSDAVTAAANRGALAAWHNHVKKMAPAKQRLFMRETINSDSSIPQSPLSCSPVQLNPALSPSKRDADKPASDVATVVVSTPLTTEASSDCEIMKRNETDDEKLKKSIAAAVATLEPDETTSDKPSDQVAKETKSDDPQTDQSASSMKKKTPSPLPIKKRRLHAVIADALNQSVQSDASSSTSSSRNMSPVVTNSSSDSDIPLAIIREKLQKAKQQQITPATTPPIKTPPPSSDTLLDEIPKIRIRKQDFITNIEASLKTFKTNVVTPEITSSSSSDNDDEPIDLRKGQKRGRPTKKVTPSPRPRIKRTASSMSTSSSALDPRELQQLAPFMLLSSSEDESESESDDDYRSRAQFDSDVERRQTRSPGSTTKMSPSVTKKVRSPKMEPKDEKKKPVKRSLESVLKRVSDLKKTKPDESKPLPKMAKKQRKQSNAALEKFFAAEKEMDEGVTTKKEKSPKLEKSIKAEKSIKVEKSIKTEKIPKTEPRKRKSNTPRKLEIVTVQDTWEHSEETVVDTNTSKGKDYLISERMY